MQFSEAAHASGSTLQTAFAAIRDFLVLTVGGWVAIDQTPVGGRTSCVFFSRGSSGLEDIYVRMEIDPTANSINFFCYLFWDELAHQGFQEAGIGATTVGMTFPNLQAATVSCLAYNAVPSLTYPSGLRMWGDRDAFHVFSYSRPTQGGANSITGTPNGGISVGLLDRTADDIQTYLSKPAYPDSIPVVLSVVTTYSTGAGGSTFWPNKDYQIMSATRGNPQIETVRIAPGGVNHGARTLTVNSLEGYYPAGSKIGVDPQPVAVSDAVFGTQRFWMPHSFNTPLGRVECGAFHGMEPPVGELSDFTNGFMKYPSLYRTMVVTNPVSDGGRFEVRGLRKFAYVMDRGSALASGSDQNGRGYRVLKPVSYSGGTFIDYSFALRVS